MPKYTEEEKEKDKEIYEEMTEMTEITETQENTICRKIFGLTVGKFCNETTRDWFNREMNKVENKQYYTRMWGWYIKEDGHCAAIYFDTITRNFYTMAVLENTNLMYKSGCNPDDFLTFIYGNECAKCYEEREAEEFKDPDDRMDKKMSRYARDEGLFTKDIIATATSRFGEKPKDHWKIIAGLTFARKKAEMDNYIASRMCLLKEANKNNRDEETMDLCLEGVWRQLERRFSEWCDKLLE